MENLIVKITGEGTAHEIGVQLVALAHTFLSPDVVKGMLESTGEFDLEDHILMTEVSLAYQEEESEEE